MTINYSLNPLDKERRIKECQKEFIFSEKVKKKYAREEFAQEFT